MQQNKRAKHCCLAGFEYNLPNGATFEPTPSERRRRFVAVRRSMKVAVKSRDAILFVVVLHCLCGFGLETLLLLWV